MKKIKKKNVKTKQVRKPKNNKLWIGISAVLAVLMISGVLIDHFNKREILTINKAKYDMADLGYYFYSVESKYNYYNQMFGGSYWDMKIDEKKGTTMRDTAKDEAVNTALSTEVLNKEAKAKGYSLTDKEKKTIATNVTSAIKTEIPKNVQTKNNFTKSYLTSVFNKETLANRYRDDMIKSFNIDDAKITAGVSKEDNRQYDIEYVYISTQKTDKDNKTVVMTADEKKTAYDKITALLPKTKATKDWSTLLPKDEKELTYSKNNFIEKDANSTFSEKFRTMMKKMANNDVSEVYEDTNGYYIVRMINNNSTESYDNAVKQAISTAENEAFDKYYKDILKNYKYNINKKELENYTMGEITL